MNKEAHLSAHWDLMLATVEEVAAHDNSSVNRLQEEFLEEFGRLPTSELIDYFADILKTDNEKTHLKRQVQKKVTIEKKPTPEMDPEIDLGMDPEMDPEIEFTDKITVNNQVTVLTFRKSFEITFGKKPPLELVAHFLKRVAYLRRQPSKKSGNLDNVTRVNFVRDFISGESPTVLKFRLEFEKKFGNPPNSVMITLFLKELSKI